MLKEKHNKLNYNHQNLLMAAYKYKNNNDLTGRKPIIIAFFKNFDKKLD